MPVDYSKILVEIGAILKDARIKKGLTLLELEMLTAIAEGDISKIENGKRNITLSTLIKITTSIDLSLSDLFYSFK